MSALISIAAFALVLGVLVFVHEFGHYAVAKLCGVRVEVFSLGFGKRLLGFKRGDTDYRLSLLPLGGYVKMAGENPMESRTGDPGEFMSHPRWQRFLIAIAGPVMNILLAVVVLTVVYMVHHEYFAFLKKPAQIAWVVAGSPAEKAGVRPDDRIIKVDGIENPNWEQVMIRTMMSADQQVDVVLQRGNQVITTKMYPRAVGPDQIGQTGMVPEGPARVAVIEAGLPAEKAGIQLGDMVVALNQKPVKSMAQFSDLLQESKSDPIDVTVLRNGQQMTFKLTPVSAQSASGEDKKYRIGIGADEERLVEKLPFKAALAQSVEECRSNSFLIFELVGKMIQRRSMKQISGPIGIARISGEAARQKGWTPLFSVMALISINLAIFNLFPIPILDGGLMLMLLIEGIMRRDIKQQVKERVYQAAFVFLVLFAAVVIFNDVAKTWSGHPF
ncbi:MAG TPA: RIP metalloprotease RseP [Candidatus Solibacter sp.]|jgi:regulator of sigma E protease|nr:RIP metalloprotease RseP [Candidatus Solibacter sp.]